MSDRNTEHAKQELAAILASPTFRASPKLSSLLDYLFANQKPGALTQTVIAAEFFGRGSSQYDPKADSLVRTEIRRLRLKLAEYYTNEGSTAPGRLEIPKGAYEVVWRERVSSPPSVSPAFRWRLQYLIPAVGVAAMVVALGFGLNSRLPRNPPRTIAVLPFSGSPPFADTVSDDLSRRLTRSKELRVTARNSTSKFVDRTDSLKTVGERLAVEGVVEGSLHAGPDGKLAIEASLTDLRTGRKVWTRKVTGGPQDLPQLEDELSAGLLSALALPALRPLYHPKSQAWDLYISGLQKMRNAKPEEALDQFTKAAKLDPDFAAAEVARARIYFVQTNNGFMDSAVALPKAEASVRLALKSDPTSSDAHTVLGNLFYARHDWVNARSEYQTAIELDHSSATAYMSIAMLLTVMGRFDEAERELGHAITLDPLWYGPQLTLAEIHYYARRYEQSFEAADQFEKRFPGMSGASLKARARRRQGRSAEAVRSELPAHPLGDVFKAICAGDRERAAVLLRAVDHKKDFRSNWVRSSIAMELGDHEDAIKWLQKSLSAAEPDLCSLNVDPLYDPVRKDPRCQRILRDLNLAN